MFGYLHNITELDIHKHVTIGRNEQPFEIIEHEHHGVPQLAEGGRLPNLAIDFAISLSSHVSNIRPGALLLISQTSFHDLSSAAVNVKRFSVCGARLVSMIKNCVDFLDHNWLVNLPSVFIC